MDGTAVLLTVGRLATGDAKTAHGLIRGTERYRVLAVIDAVSAGRDAGEVLDGRGRGIPVLPSLAEARAALPRIDHAVIGIATPGGRITPELRALASEALAGGISVVNGLHDFLSEMPELVELAARTGARIIDVRKPPSKARLHFWTGAIKRVTCPKIAVLGTDCSIGKRTTARLLTETARARGLRAEMIYTGQTGWMQGGRHGLVLDAMYNDFVSGELEHAIVSCFDDERPDVIVVEGQAALRNPSGPCGSELLVSGRMDAVVLQHHLGRTHYHDIPSWGEIAPVEDEITLIANYGVPVLAITANTAGLDEATAAARSHALSQRLGLPVVRPLAEGVGPVFDVVAARFALAGKEVR